MYIAWLMCLVSGVGQTTTRLLRLFVIIMCIIYPSAFTHANAPLSLVYIDDVCASFINLLSAAQVSGKQAGGYQHGGYKEIKPIYHTTVSAVAEALQKFKQSRANLITEEVGAGLMCALYSTYLSYFSPSDFAYTDPRGSFVEMLKIPLAGQFSFFTAHPGVTRDGHYHHTKNEKFLLIKGIANYRFREIITGEQYDITVDAREFKIIETVPGWAHDITNIGNEELIVMLWANEIFDRKVPDTLAYPL